MYIASAASEASATIDNKGEIELLAIGNATAKTEAFAEAVVRRIIQGAAAYDEGDATALMNNEGTLLMGAWHKPKPARPEPS